VLSLLEALYAIGNVLLAIVDLLASWRLFLCLALGVSVAVLAVWLMPEHHLWISVPAVFAGLAAGVWWELRDRDKA
jgi:hypothetical protein